MAYMRGDYYLWDDVSGLHLWAADGYDGWDESGWHHHDDGDIYPVHVSHLKDGVNNASGVSIPQPIMDEYVVMRFAEMLAEGIAGDATTRALDKWEGNISCGTLSNNADALRGLVRAAQFTNPRQLQS